MTRLIEESTVVKTMSFKSASLPEIEVILTSVTQGSCAKTLNLKVATFPGSTAVSSEQTSLILPSFAMLDLKLSKATSQTEKN